MKIDPSVLSEHQPFIESLIRQMTRDEHVIEDIVQETFLAALTHRIRDEGALRPWLRAVAFRLSLRSFRSRDRRRRREAAVARTDSVASTDREAQRREDHALVVEAVRNLESLYSHVLHLRYFEGLSVGEIAERHNLPEETIRSRIKRGRKKVEAKLSRRFGGDRRACLAYLVGLTSESPARGTAPLVTGGGTAVSMASPARFIALTLALVTMSWVAITSCDSTRVRTENRHADLISVSLDSTRPARKTGPDAVATLSRTSRHRERAPASVRMPSTPTPPRRGLVRGRIEWSDASPAHGVRLGILSADLTRAQTNDRRGDDLRLVTDRNGEFTTTLPLGTYSVLVDRTDRVWSLAVTRERENEIHLRLLAGIDVMGRTLGHAGIPVKGAEVSLFAGPRGSDFGSVVAVSDANGSFLIRDVSARRRLAVTSQDHAGAVVTVDGTRRRGLVEVDLRARSLESVGGRLVSRDGDAIPGARVVVENMDITSATGSDGRVIYTRPARRSYSDASGHFSIAGVGGPSYVLIEADGFAPRVIHTKIRENIDLGRVILQTSAGIRGQVRDPYGNGLAGATVWIEDREAQCPSRGPRQVTTDALGRFEVGGLAPGEILVDAHVSGGHDWARTSLEVCAGTVVTCDLEIARSRDICAVLRRDNGEPLVGWSVFAKRSQIDVRREYPLREGFSHPHPVERDPRLEKRSLSFTTTDDAGEFCVAAGPESTCRLLFFPPGSDTSGPPWLDVPSVRATTVPLEFVVPDADFRGGSLVVERLGGHCNRLVVQSEALPSRRLTAISDKSSIELERVPPGHYRVWVEQYDSETQPIPRIRDLGEREIRAGLTLRIGDVPEAGLGSLVAFIGDPEGAAPFRISRSEGRIDVAYVFDEGVIRAGGLQPGRYELLSDGRSTHSFGARCVEFEIRAGEQQTLHVELPEGNETWIELREPPGYASDEVYVSLRCEDGQPVWHGSVGRYPANEIELDRRFILRIGLARARYEISARSDTGLFVTTEIDSSSGLDFRRPIVIPLTARADGHDDSRGF